MEATGPTWLKSSYLGLKHLLRQGSAQKWKESQSRPGNSMASVTSGWRSPCSTQPTFTSPTTSPGSRVRLRRNVGTTNNRRWLCSPSHDTRVSCSANSCQLCLCRLNVRMVTTGTWSEAFVLARAQQHRYKTRREGHVRRSVGQSGTAGARGETEARGVKSQNCEGRVHCGELFLMPLSRKLKTKAAANIKRSELGCSVCLHDGSYVDREDMTVPFPGSSGRKPTLRLSVMECLDPWPETILGIYLWL